MPTHRIVKKDQTGAVFHKQSNDRSTVRFPLGDFPDERKFVEFLAAVGLKKSWYLPMGDRRKILVAVSNVLGDSEIVIPLNLEVQEIPVRRGTDDDDKADSSCYCELCGKWNVWGCLP